MKHVAAYPPSAADPDLLVNIPTAGGGTKHGHVVGVLELEYTGHGSLCFGRRSVGLVGADIIIIINQVIYLVGEYSYF